MSVAVSVVPSAAATAQSKIRVMVVDDAVVVPGREAVDQLERADPDVVILDVEMPVLDGISALPLLLEKKRDLVVIMASTVTRRNAEISLKALALGAAAY